MSLAQGGAHERCFLSTHRDWNSQPSVSGHFQGLQIRDQLLKSPQGFILSYQNLKSFSIFDKAEAKKKEGNTNTCRAVRAGAPLFFSLKFWNIKFCATMLGTSTLIVAREHLCHAKHVTLTQEAQGKAASPCLYSPYLMLRKYKAGPYAWCRLSVTINFTGKKCSVHYRSLKSTQIQCYPFKHQTQDFSRRRDLVTTKLRGGDESTRNT